VQHLRTEWSFWLGTTIDDLQLARGFRDQRDTLEMECLAMRERLANELLIQPLVVLETMKATKQIEEDQLDTCIKACSSSSWIHTRLSLSGSSSLAVPGMRPSEPSTWTRSGRGWTRNRKRSISRSLLNVRAVKEMDVLDFSGMKISSSERAVMGFTGALWVSMWQRACGLTKGHI